MTDTAPPPDDNPLSGLYTDETQEAGNPKSEMTESAPPVLMSSNKMASLAAKDPNAVLEMVISTLVDMIEVRKLIAEFIKSIPKEYGGDELAALAESGKFMIGMNANSINATKVLLKYYEIAGKPKDRSGRIRVNIGGHTYSIPAGDNEWIIYGGEAIHRQTKLIVERKIERDNREKQLKDGLPARLGGASGSSPCQAGGSTCAFPELAKIMDKTWGDGFAKEAFPNSTAPPAGGEESD
ncbi:MAG: hypothetical protein ACR2PR_09180 [Pseudohongiellaceae bacterium]